MNRMRVAITGAAGRMGHALIQAAQGNDQLIITGALEQAGNPHIGDDAGELAGIGAIDVQVSDDPLEIFIRSDAVIDFSTPQSSCIFAAHAAQARIAHIIGTTGFSESEERDIAAASRHAPIVKSGNMSLGITLLANFVQQATRALDESFDIEIVEMHHRNKVDAPSGTALMLGRAAAQGRGVDLNERSVRARDGHTGLRREGDIGFATLRGGAVIGEHKVILAGTHERIELVHRADDRSIFAHGALKAALWAHQRKPGLYSMADVLGMKMDLAGNKQ